jgi:hypothetical protein
VIFPRVRAIPAGTVLRPNYTVIGLTRDGSALVYRIPNRQGGRPSEKNIPAPEWEIAYKQLITSGKFDRPWFDSNVPCAKNGGCNFKVIGEVFVFLELADRERARYVLAPEI